MGAVGEEGTLEEEVKHENRASDQFYGIHETSTIELEIKRLFLDNGLREGCLVVLMQQCLFRGVSDQTERQ